MKLDGNVTDQAAPMHWSEPSTAAMPQPRHQHVLKLGVVPNECCRTCRPSIAYAIALGSKAGNVSSSQRLRFVRWQEHVADLLLGRHLRYHTPPPPALGAARRPPVLARQPAKPHAGISVAGCVKPRVGSTLCNAQTSRSCAPPCSQRDCIVQIDCISM